MQKIMFDDNFGLTAAVLSGRKIMTRRLISCQVDAALANLMNESR